MPINIFSYLMGKREAVNELEPQIIRTTHENIKFVSMLKMVEEQQPGFTERYGRGIMQTMREINYDRTALEFQNEFIYESIRRDTAERANILRRVRQNVGINDMRVDSLRRVYNLLDTHDEISRENMALVRQDINTAERVLSDGTNELAVIMSDVQGKAFALQNITDQRASANLTLEEMRQTTTAIKNEFERLSGMLSESTDMIEQARSDLDYALSDLEQSATDKSLLEKQRDELTIEIDKRTQQATTLLDRLNVERSSLATVKQELRHAEGELFIQQTDEMATIDDMQFKHTQELITLTGKKG